jgi:CheY-like chemotaxis protein
LTRRIRCIAGFPYAVSVVLLMLCVGGFGDARRGKEGVSLKVVRMRRSGLDPEPWAWPGRPRVLVEHDDEAAGLLLASALREAGYGVAVCPGPAEEERCPLAGAEGCAIAHGADVVVSCLGLERVEGREVLGALRARCPAIPLVVEVSAGQEEQWPALLGDCELVYCPIAPEQLLTAVSRALEKVS